MKDVKRIKISINKDNSLSMESLMNYLNSQLEFPSYFGGTLDSLWDILTDINIPMEIEWNDYSKSLRTLGQKAIELRSMFKDLQDEDPKRVKCIIHL